MATLSNKLKNSLTYADQYLSIGDGFVLSIGDGFDLLIQSERLGIKTLNKN